MTIRCPYCKESLTLRGFSLPAHYSRGVERLAKPKRGRE
jgi:hypothetical protein